MTISKELVLSLYRTMVEIRDFELKAYELFRSGKMPGFILPKEALSTAAKGGSKSKGGKSDDKDCC